MHDEKTRRWGRYFTYILSIFDYELYWPCSLLVISRNFHYISFLIFAVLRRRQKAVSFLCKNGFYDKMTDDRLSTDQEGHNITTLQKYFIPFTRQLKRFLPSYQQRGVHQCMCPDFSPGNSRKFCIWLQGVECGGDPNVSNFKQQSSIFRYA